MKHLDLLIPLIFLTFTGCTPASLVQLPEINSDDAATVTVYRESAFNAGGVTMVFGANEDDYVKLSNGQYSIIKLQPKKYDFFVRATQADEPYILTLTANKNEDLCLKAFANPANLGKTMLPFLYYFTNTFLLEKINCPSESFFSEYSRTDVTYSNNL